MAPYNEDLATRRARIAQSHLIACGVPADRIIVAVYGDNRARRRPDPLDRRVVLFASEAPLSQVVSAELDRDAIERRGRGPAACIARPAGSLRSRRSRRPRGTARRAGTAASLEL